MDGIPGGVLMSDYLSSGKGDSGADALSRKVRNSALQMVQVLELGDFAIEGRIQITNIQVQPEWLQ
jgi:hypothetical protein